MKAEPEPQREWVHRSGVIGLSRPVVMGILNTTPDSFSDGGLALDPVDAMARAERMVEEGAEIIDIGGESTRPGAAAVDPGEEMARVLPVIGQLRGRIGVPLSIDTRRAEVARAALEAGVDIVNDVSAFGDPEMPALVAESGAGVVLMHMRGAPATMQVDPRYRDVVEEVTDELRGRLRIASEAGIRDDHIVVDPGIGFAKTHRHNVELISSLRRLSVLGRPILLGISRKAFLGELLGGAAVGERMIATVAGCVVGMMNGAQIFRVHDVRAVRQALDVAHVLGTFAPND